MSPEKGWYADPVSPELERVWDGTAWTRETRPAHQRVQAAPTGPGPPRATRREGGSSRWTVPLLVTSAFLLGVALVGGGLLVWAPWNNDATGSDPGTGLSQGEPSESAVPSDQDAGGDGTELQLPLEIAWQSREVCSGREWAFTQDSVFFVTGQACREVAAIDTQDGSLRWSTRTEAHDHDDELSAMRLELIDGIVIAGRDDPFLSGDGGPRHVVSGFDVETGELLWAGGYDGWYASRDRLYAISQGRLAAIDPATGDVRWSSHGNDGQVIRSAPVITEGQVAVVMASPPGGDSDDPQFAELVGLDHEDGTERWRAPLELPLDQPLAIGDVVIVGGSDASSGISGIEASSGEPLWERSDLELRQIDAVTTHLFVRDDRGRTMLNSETGETIWSIPVTSRRVTAAGGTLLAVDMDVEVDPAQAAPLPELAVPTEGAESIRGTLTVEGTPVPGVEVDVLRDGQSVGTSVSNADGEWIVELPMAGTYVAQMQVRTLPPGVELRDPDRTELELRVREGGQATALFALEASNVERTLRAFRIDSGQEVWDIDLGEGPGVADIAVGKGRFFVFGVDGSLTAWESAS